jgi:hypothetical protein
VVVTIIQPAATISIGAGDTQFAPAAGTTAFVLPSAGTYLCTFTGPFVVATGSGATTGQVKIVFDLGAPAEQLIGYNASWQWRTASDYTFPLFSARVAFAVGGAHTLVCYAKEISGTSLQVIGTVTVAVGGYTITLTEVVP